MDDLYRDGGRPGKNDVISDDVIYRRFLEGDTAIYDELMVRYGDSLTVYLHGITHDWHDAEDLMIEAFARIMVRKPRIKEGAFKAYLFRAGRNMAFNLTKRRRTHPEFSLDDMSTEPATDEFIEAHLVGEEQKEALHACLERIDPTLREAMWLVYIEGMSYDQAARVMKVNTKKVDHLLARGKKVMRTELGEEGVHSAYG